MSIQPLQKIQAIAAVKAYFIERKTKSQIADELGISRFRVARILDEAIESGLIKFVIAEQDEIDSDLSQRLAKKFAIRQVVVLSGPNAAARTLIPQLGALGASVVEELLTSGMNVGIASGRVLSAMADALKHLPFLDVVQATGALPGMEFSHNSIELVHRIAQVGEGKAHPIYIPMWVDSPETAQNLLREPSVAAVHERYNHLDVLITGIGSWTQPESCMFNTFPEAWRQQVLKNGVCADLCTALIDEEGNLVPSPLDQLSLSIKPEQIRKIPEIIAIAGGQEKHAAIAAALKGRWVTTLITDAGTARYLLSL
ncbi:sugar-binding transcriptional regulator [Escherichia albertii]|uniref:sugar-binding transcriptional regulator n=2 Tax=Escherichia albertii TaxID=208962 RepID=UPI0006A24D59|nr:sugar-binding domain-containing protein [Escherichia albertii]CTV66851.1 DeoR family transcriptional regulator [Escherichia coli]EFF0782383.1 DNA-binding transcriptional regulator [Escherichia albertii]EFF0798464.1 DNA-binding transcriptional regulator [Escherichia albertii]EHG7530688.1 DNA-binding transcriptional regulator [Escherichia albertii]EJS1736762.1 DNA-binding transcriptional regulator [Escherichia albertii]